MHIFTSNKASFELLEIFELFESFDSSEFCESCECFESFKFLETFSVEQEDLLKVINYLNSIILSDNNKVKPLILFTKEKLDNLVEECTEFILAYLNKI